MRGGSADSHRIPPTLDRLRRECQQALREDKLPRSLLRRMQDFIADNPPGKHGIHFYEPHEFGVVPEKVRDEFSEYIAHFDLQPE